MSPEKYHYTYFAYGLTISSQFPINGFTRTISKDPDIVIKIDKTPDRLKVVKNQNRFYQSNGDEYLLRVKDIATYYITGGRIVTIQQGINAKPDEISAYLGGIVMGAIFHQRSLLPLHASSVIYNGKCMVFAGNAGSGKSTLAALLVKSGAKLIADDISVVGFSNKIPVIYPAFPYLKVWKQNLTQLGITSDHLLKVPLEKDKFYYPASKFAENKTGVDHLFIVDTHNKNKPETLTLQGIQKFSQLKKYGYLANSVSNTPRERTHFEMINALASKVPAVLISRPEVGFNIDQLMSVILYCLDE